MAIKYDNCKDCVSGCEHAGKDREFVCSKEVSCKVTGAKTSDREALECVQTLLTFCKAQRGCRDCIFHLREPGCWTCNLKKLDLLDMQEIKANIAAKRKEGKT